MLLLMSWCAEEEQIKEQILYFTLSLWVYESELYLFAAKYTLYYLLKSAKWSNDALQIIPGSKETKNAFFKHILYYITEELENLVVPKISFKKAIYWNTIWEVLFTCLLLMDYFVSNKMIFQY